MAALRPCPFIVTALASSNLDRSQPRTRGVILPLDRSNSTLKISRAPPGRSSTLLKSNRGIRAHRGAAGEPFGPKPDPEELMRKYMTPEQQKIWDECIKFANGPPDRPFREEIDILREYWVKVRDEIFFDKSILHPGTASLSWALCSKAHHAAVLASEVVDCALLRHGKDEISVHTTKQTMRTYVSVFVSTAEDSYHKKVEMNNLKDKLASAYGHGLLDLYKILTPTLHHAVASTKACVLKMIGTRKMALGHHLPGAPKAPNDS